MPLSPRSTATSVAVLVAAAVLIPWANANAQSYAALDEAPATGGELRLIAPRPSQEAPASPALGFPLKHTDVDVQIDGVMARVVVEQTFENPYAETLDAVYVFPLGPDAAVSAYEFALGERVVKGTIAEREEARQRFEEARAQGQTAGLLQQEKPNVFTQEIANLPPGEQIAVRFEYTELIAHWDGAFEFVFPMVVGPRYLPGHTTDARPVVGLPAGSSAPPGVTAVSFLPPGQRSGHDIDVRVALDPGVPLVDFSSATHALVDGGVLGTQQRLALDPGDTVPNKDLVLRWATAGEQTLVGALTHRADGDGFVNLVLHPKAEYSSSDLAPREVVLLIDRSGSMSGMPMAAAKDAAYDLLASLRPGDRFAVLSFSDSVQAFAPAPVVADASNIAAAQGWVSTLRTGGGTEMLDGLRRAIDAPLEDERVRAVYLLSDGEVGNDDDILAALDGTGGLRVYPVGIGSAPNRYLFDRTAERARGFATYIAPRDDVAVAVDELVARSTSPYLTDISIDWGGLAVHSPTPAALPDLHAGEPLVLSARYDRPGSGEIVLKARRGGQPVEVPLTLELPAEDDRVGVAHLWARRRIHELKSEALGQPGRPAKAEITKLGLQFGLVTDYTSYVAVDETRTVDRTGARSITQAVDLPEGMDWAGTFGGATTGSSTTASPSVTAAAAPRPSPQAPPRTSSSAPRRSSGGYGGGAIDPVSGLLLLGLGGAAAARRKKA